MSARGATKVAIYDAALDAFAERGYLGASLRDIAQRVGLEVASLYNHYDSKEALLFEIIMITSQELCDYLEEVRAGAGDHPREALKTMLRGYTLFETTHPRQSFVGTVELRALTPEHRAEAMAMRDRVEGMFKTLVAECSQAGYLPKDLPPTVGAYQVIAMATGVSAWFDPDGPLTGEEIADRTVELFANGLHSRKF